MRFVTSVLIVLALAARAYAADLPEVLRGSQPVGPANFFNWSGLYVGGQFGASDTKADFSKSTSAPVAYVLRETTLQNEFNPAGWPVLGTGDHTATAYGGFIGYNAQWQDVILGIEGNYNHSSATLIAADNPISRITPSAGGNNYLVNLSGSGTLTGIDYGTLRGRAGWIVGNFLPYGFVGLAAGRANINVSATVDGEQNPPSGGGACLASNTPPCTPFFFSDSVGRNPAWLIGFAAGAGLDVALTQHFFLRAEYEFVQFAPVSSVLVTVNSARLGAGFKF
jgi:outer membrane immunogenic protein